MGGTSIIWDYFEKDIAQPSHAKCKACNVKVSRGSSNPKLMTTTNLKTHLKKHHKELYDQLNEKKIAEINVKRKAEEDAQNGSGTVLKNKKQKEKFLQETLPEAIAKTQVWPIGHTSAKEAHKRVLLMIIQDLKPFSEVNHGGLLQLLKFLQPKFELGSDKFYRDMMQTSYKKCRQSLQELLKKSNPQHVSLVLDGWSQFHHGYIGVNIHFIDENWKRRKLNLCCSKFDESHTGAAMADFVKSLTEEWNIYHLICSSK